MPLPKTRANIHFLDKDSNIVEDVVFTKKETGYKAEAEYYPSMVAVRCGVCGEIGVAEFLGGLNLKEGDRLMNSRSIRGTCLKCNKRVELIPLPKDQQNQGRLRLHYQIQESLTEAARRGESLGPSGMIWPLARVREWERWKNGEAAGA